jgi:hypothetical protein
LARNGEPGLIGLIERQTDHDGRVCHAASPRLPQYS